MRKLADLRIGRSCVVNSVEVKRIDIDEFSIDGNTFTLDQVIRHIASIKSNTSGLQYDSTAFVITLPGSNSRSIHKASNRTEHRKLVDLAKSQSRYLYYGSVYSEGGKYYIREPLIVDWDSVSDSVTSLPATNKFVCQHCKKVLSSASGYVLHIRTKHSGEFINKRDDEDAISTLREAQENAGDDNGQSLDSQLDEPQKALKEKPENNVLSCPYCDKTVTSTPGRTLHVKNKHPDKFDEYRSSLSGV